MATDSPENSVRDESRAAAGDSVRVDAVWAGRLGGTWWKSVGGGAGIWLVLTGPPRSCDVVTGVVTYGSLPDTGQTHPIISDVYPSAGWEGRQAMPWFHIDLSAGWQTIHLGISTQRLNDCRDLRLLLIGECFKTPHHRSWVEVPIEGHCPVDSSLDR